MNPLIRRWAGRLLSAGVFTLGGLAPLGSTRAAEPAQVTGVPLVAPGQLRQEAIKVELALLGDRATYALPLQVRTQGESIEVCGAVPSEALHLRALELARRNCYLPVQDRMTLPSAVPPEATPLGRAAHDQLVQHLGSQADAVHVAIRGDGQVTLSGQVYSMEDKLTASRCLRGLPGCAGLINRLQVRDAAGKPSFTLITHDAAEETHQPQPAAMPAEPARAPAVATLPSGLGTSRALVVRVNAPDRPAEQSHAVIYYSPAQATAGSCAALGQRTRPAEAEGPSLCERFLRRFCAGQRPCQAVVAAQPPAPRPAGFTGPQAQTQRLTPVAARTTAWPPAHRTEPELITPLPADATYQSRPLGYYARQMAVRPQSPMPVPAVTTAEPPRLAEPSGLEQTSAVSPVKPAAKATVKPAPKPTAKLEAKPITSQQLVQKVKTTCGRLARDVRAEAGADGVLTVHVYARPGAEQRLTAKLFEVPDLAGSKIRLHVHLAP